MMTPTELRVEAEKLSGLSKYHYAMIEFLGEASTLGADARKLTAALWREYREIQRVEEMLEEIRTEALRELTT
jgi:hypothetical protein